MPFSGFIDAMIDATISRPFSWVNKVDYQYCTQITSVQSTIYIYV